MNKTNWIKSCFLATLCILTLTLCNNDKVKESKDAAEESNVQKFEDKNIEKDARFLVHATSDSYDQIKLASVAITKTTNGAIKKMAEEIKDEHSAIITELNSMASNKSVTIANTPSEEANTAAMDLSKSSLGSFNKDWLKKIEDLQKITVKIYEDASNKSVDANIKSWASVTLIKIRSHLERIKKLADNIK